MRFLQFTTEENPKTQIGLLQADSVVSLNAYDSSLPNSLVEFWELENALDIASQAIKNPKVTIPVLKVKFLAPITKPDKLVGVGLNYKEHCEENNLPYPPEPILFAKFGSNIIGPTDNIVHPNLDVSNELDWEVELAVIIGKQGKNIPIENAFDYILGYTVAQDLTARDWQERNGGQWLTGKAMDTFCPLGPIVVTKEEVPDPQNLQLKTWVNGVIKQNGNTKNMIFKIDFLISRLSSIATLYPGDVILSGTPGGVGKWSKPQQFLKKGDTLTSEIEGIGKLHNVVV